jgi:periplasmic protein TonB
MTDHLPTSDKKRDDRDNTGLNWPRITAISFAIAAHITAIMLLLVPVTPPGAQQDEEEVTSVVIIEPPPPPPAPPSPPAPSAPPRNTDDLRASICSKPSLAPLQAAAGRAGGSTDLVLALTFQADGTVTDVSIAKSSRNRDLDRAAQTWARKVKLCPGAAGTGRLPFSFSAE